MAESPIANEFARPQGWRFAFEGVNLREVPDALSPTKFAGAKNIRATSKQSVQTRPGYVPFFTTGGAAITDVGSFAALGTDDAPRFLARDANGRIWLDTGTNISATNAPLGFGVFLLPWRPSESPQTWMYIASLGDYIKIQAPTASFPTGVAQKVGIAEPQAAIDASAIPASFTDFTGTASNWTPDGVMGALTASNRTVDTAGVVFQDPINPTRSYVQVNPAAKYGVGELLSINSLPVAGLIEAVLGPAQPMTVQSIRYYVGTSGSCMVSVGQVPNTGDPLSPLVRNSIIQFSTGEYCVVTSVETGPDGSVALETSTVGTISSGMTIVGVSSATITDNSASIIAGQSLLGPVIASGSTAAGLATASRPLATSPFSTNSGVGTPESEDYVHLSVEVFDPSNINEIKILFSLGPSGGTLDFTGNYYYYSLQPSQLAGVVTNQQTQLQTALDELVQSTVPPGTALPDSTVPGQLQWTDILIPISSLIRVGGNPALNLETCNGVQIVFNTAIAQFLSWGSLWVGHQGQPDVGDAGADYRYRAVPRSSLTGVRGNPTPVMRYGVRPRRQQVIVTLPDASYDPQIDTWDIERYGGSVTSYRYIGSSPSNSTQFTDNFSDAAAEAGSLMETDNFEPWPSIDVPFKVDQTQATITVVGTFITISGYSQWPVSTINWLPGTLIQLSGQSAFTLRSRPVLVNSNTFRFELEEVVNPAIAPRLHGGLFYFWVLEPKVANSKNPYVFGPDATGTFFGVGDQYRPGTLSYCKQYTPDSVPDQYNQDLCPPSEPLIGGVIKGSTPIVASTKRWWALYPQFSGLPRFNAIEQNVGRGLITPYAICTDGVTVYFWMKDGIGSTDGGPYKNITKDDLYQLFPHEGIQGVNITRYGDTYYAPDYSRLPTFRLSIVKDFLFADYQDSTGAPRTLVMDRRTGGWQPDYYHDPITGHYSTSQQSGSLTSAPAKYTTAVLFDANGNVWVEQDCTNDNGVPIQCLVAPFEWDGGDQRMQPLFGDSYLDCVPMAAITAQPVSQGANICAPTVIAASGNRTFAPISVQGGELQKFLGTVYTWSE